MAATRSAFRTKLIAGALAPLVLAAGVQALYSVVSQRREAIAGLEAKARSLASLLVNVAGPSVAFDDAKGVDESLAYVQHDPDFEFALAVAPDGKVLGYRGPAGDRAAHVAAVPGTRGPALERGAGTLIASEPIVSNDKLLGSLVLGLRSARAEAKAAKLTAWAALISGVGIAAAIAVVLGLAGRITRRNREMANLLAHMEQGFLSMKSDGTLADERSAIARRLLGDPRPGQHLWDAIAPHDPAVAAWLEVGWAMAVDEALPLDLAIDQLPSKLVLADRSYRVEYKPTIAHGKITDTLIVLTDETAELARRRAEASERDLLRMIERMARDRAGCSEFVDETERLVQRLRAHHGTEPSAVFKRELHTLKGNSATFGLPHIAEACHVLEDDLEANATIAPPLLDAIIEAWTILRAKLRTVFGGNGVARVEISKEDLDELHEAIGRGAPLVVIDAIVKAWSLERVKPRLERFAEQVHTLAAQLGKGAVDVDIADHGVRLDPARFRAFWTAFSHVVRNAVDHGLESPDERTTAGKPEQGHIALETRQEGATLVVELRDDGRGIDWDRVRDRARAEAQPCATQADLLHAILRDGFSTRTEVTETSGRGVGLAALNAVCNELGGQIEVDSERGRGTRFRFRFAAA